MPPAAVFAPLGCSSERDSPLAHPPVPTATVSTLETGAAPPAVASVKPSSASPAAAASPSGQAVVSQEEARYPVESIQKALFDNGDKSCRRLVYKRGCAQTRTGKIKVVVVLGPDGRAERFGCRVRVEELDRAALSVAMGR